MRRLADTGEGSESGVVPAVAVGSSRVETAQTVIRRTGSELPPPPSEQATPAEVAKVLEGAELGNFRLQCLIGGGGMGAVFRAADTRLDRTVAIKVIPRVGEDPDLLRRFKNEAQSAAKLDHPNIARVYDVGQENGWHYIVFEHIDGINLRDLVAQEGVLSIDDAVYYTRQVAEALEHANERGVVHRDIKPSNVLVTSSGQVKLVDMGLARSQHVEVTDDMTASGVTLGTFDYISPEQARDPREADVRSDLYSLGCTLYFILVGRPPFPGGSIVQKLMNHGNAPPPNPAVFRPEIHPDLTAIIHKLLAKKPSDRYPRPADVIADLHHLSKQLGLTRSAAMGTTSVPTPSVWPSLLQQHLPWIVAVSLLLLSTVWIQMMSAGESDLQIPRPDELRSRPQSVANSLASNESPPDDTPAAMVGPTSPADSEASRLRLAAAELKDATNDPPPVPWTTLIVNPSARADDPRAVRSLLDALEKAKSNAAIDTIELRADEIEVGQLRIPRSGLKIRVAEGFAGMVILKDDAMPAMEPPIKIVTGGHGIAFEGVHFFWQTGSARDGGAVFGLTGQSKEKIELSDCSITIDNLARRSDVFAFQVKSNADTTPSRTPTATSAGLLVWLKLKNCVFRGQMTLIGMDSASRLDVEWTNGLLATSGRFLETGGAAKASFAMEQIKIKLDHVTAHCDEGFARVQITPAASYPVMLNRSSNSCTFVSAPETRQFEIAGLEDLQATAAKCLSMQGKNNAYQLDENRMGVIYRASDTRGESLEYGWTDLNDEATWFDGFEEERPKSTVIWSDVFPRDKAVHTHVPRDYLQDGVLPPGFDPATIPKLPMPTKSL
ncbi:serine/threonine protein kinase [Rosistilla carotiformis]|uniref:serine/threonine protein kinase n=1 Tax=Rosistilla carotiformis TaxID=2528017 RepID=UPI0018D20CB4|nr:serine/threonine-protein kinase [Rosistilla carotiformis]